MSLPASNASRKVVYITAAMLVVFSLLAVSVRIAVSDRAGLPTGDSAWTIGMTHEIEALDKGAEIYIPPPWDTAYARLYAQSLSHTGMRLKRIREEQNKRDIVLTAPAAGYYTIESVFSIHVSALARHPPRQSGLSEQNRSKWLASSTGIEINSPATLGVVEEISWENLSPPERVDKLFDHVSSHIVLDPHAAADSETALSVQRATRLGATRALVALLRTAHLPARIITGVYLQAAEELQPYVWAEVYEADGWVPLDPVGGYLRELPPFYIPLRKGDDPLIITDNAEAADIEWKIDIAQPPKGLFATESRRLTDILDLNRLSPKTREIIGALLLLPLGALATEIMRQLGGVRTYGTFTPTLLALAVSHVDWRTALIVFLLVTVTGVAFRASMPNLYLQRTPRLAIVFTLVSLSMAGVVSGFMYFDSRMDSTVVLLPVVILTMLVDRIYTVADERGMKTALVRLFWTLVSAVISLVILLQQSWGAWLLTYPEMHAVTLACVILIGQYDGRKLNELAALNWLREPQAARKKKRSAGSAQSGHSGDSK